MSDVWLAEDEQLERQVALKFLAPHADRRRFEREARAAAALSHPNVERIYEYGEHEGRPFMALEYLPGGTLEERLSPRRPVPDDEAASIAADLAAGLAHAHAQGLVHRDLKPANVLFDGEGRGKIADFGIARLAGAETFTEDGTVMGTAAYISPEQAAGEAATPASDVYAFGVILFRLLTGRLPFEGDGALEVAAMHRDVEPPAIDLLRPAAPPRLAALATAALAKDPRLRPRDGAALLAHLGGTATPTAAATVVLPRRHGPTRRRIGRGWVAALVAALVLLLVGGIVTAAALTDRSSSGTTSTRHRASRPKRTTSQAQPPAAPVTAGTTAPTTTTSVSTTRPAATAPPPPPPPPPPPSTATTTTTTTESTTVGTTVTLPVPP
jgi:eukaryotic-like serine/threonine-protein kinase